MVKPLGPVGGYRHNQHPMYLRKRAADYIKENWSSYLSYVADEENLEEQENDESFRLHDEWADDVKGRKSLRRRNDIPNLLVRRMRPPGVGL